MYILTGGIILFTAAWLIGFAGWCVARPVSAAQFLHRFASTPRAHYTEQVLRLVAGLAIAMHAQLMPFLELFRIFGWLLVVTSMALMLLPWRLHQRFAQWAIPQAVRHLRLYALGSFLLGAVLAWAVLCPMLVGF